MTVKPFEIGVCSWSLQVKSIPELKGFMDRLGVDVVQIACGDPHHASWDEGDQMPRAALAAGFRMTGTMLGFPGEDYASPAAIQKTGGFGDPALRLERLKRVEWGLQRTLDLGLRNIMFHGGFIPEPKDPDRKPFLMTLERVGDLAGMLGITVALETGQETAKLLRRTLDDLKHPYIKVNFDPANMILYDMGDPIKAVEVLGPDIVSVHVKDANRTKVKGTWGEEVVLGTGQANLARWLKTLKKVGFRGALVIEREVGSRQQRFDDIAAGIRFLRECLA
jgi:sugar phosphate isomerase/epimerase